MNYNDVLNCGVLTGKILSGIIAKACSNCMKTIESISLPQKERSAILQAAESIKIGLPVSRVILFGSMARETADPYSDIDLLVLTSCSVSSKLRASVSEKLAEINLQHDVALSSITVSENDWSEGLIHHMLIHNEIERDGCEV